MPSCYIPFISRIMQWSKSLWNISIPSKVIAPQISGVMMHHHATTQGSVLPTAGAKVHKEGDTPASRTWWCKTQWCNCQGDLLPIRLFERASVLTDTTFWRYTILASNLGVKFFSPFLIRTLSCFISKAIRTCNLKHLKKKKSCDVQYNSECFDSNSFLRFLRKPIMGTASSALL